MMPRTDSAIHNFQHLQDCCHDPAEPDTSGVQHPYPPFMARAIELSRIAGLEKRTGGCFGAVVVKNGKIVGEGYNNVISRTDPTW